AKARLSQSGSPTTTGRPCASRSGQPRATISGPMPATSPRVISRVGREVMDATHRSERAILAGLSEMRAAAQGENGRRRNLAKSCALQPGTAMRRVPGGAAVRPILFDGPRGCDAASEEQDHAEAHLGAKTVRHAHEVLRGGPAEAERRPAPGVPGGA